jgi:AraC-like DNA-binding protein
MLSGAWVATTVRALIAVGVDVRALCKQEQLPYGALLDPDRMIPLDLRGALWEAVARHTNDPLIGLRAAERAEPDFDNLLIHLIAAQPNLGELLDALVEFQRLMAPGAPFSLTPEEDGVALVMAAREDRIPSVPAQIHYFVAVMLILMRRYLARRVQPSLLELAFTGPEIVARRFGEMFDCPVRLASPRFAWSFSRRELALPAAHGASEQTRAALVRTARAMLADSPSPSFATRLVAHARAQLSIGRTDCVTLPSIARSFGMSERALQRRVANEGGRFRDIVEQARRLTAWELLRAEIPRAQIARQLGYTNPIAFSRAFSRWMHEEPALPEASVPTADAQRLGRDRSGQVEADRSGRSSRSS